MDTHRLPRPPSSGGLPWLGQLPGFLRDPLRALSALPDRSGTICRFRIGPVDAVLVTRAEDIERVLVNRQRAFERGRFVSRVLSPLIGNATSMLDGDIWASHRRLTAPAYSADRLDSHLDATQQIVEDFVAAWENRPEIHAQAECMRMWMQAMGRILCGRDLPLETESFLGPIRAGLDGAGLSLKMGVPLPLWIPLPHLRAIRRGRDALRALGSTLLARHLASEIRDSSLVSRLATDSSDDEGWTRSRDDIGGNIAVGGHQIMTAFCWTLLCLCRNPDLQDELRDALAQAPNAVERARVDLLEWTIKESLRLYPPFYLIPRVAAREVELSGFRITDGTLIAMSPWVTQRSALYFSQPNEFRPSRWQAASHHRYAYFPFGGGPRACVGAPIIPSLLAIAVAAFLRNHRIERVDQERIEPVAGLSLSMSRPLVVRLIRI